MCYSEYTDSNSTYKDGPPTICHLYRPIHKYIIIMSIVPSIVICAHQWEDLPVSTRQEERETRITGFNANWSLGKPISDISYYPEKNEVKCETEEGSWAVTAYGDMTATRGTQCCIRNEKTGDKQQSMIHLHFVQPTSPTEVIASELDAQTAITAGSEGITGETTISKGQSVRDKLDGDSGGSGGTGWEFGSFGKKKAKREKSSAQTKTATAAPSRKTLAIKPFGSTSRSEAEEAEEREAMESWRQQRQNANEVTRRQNSRMQ